MFWSLGSLVTLTGTDFDAAARLSCSFGPVSVNATRLSSSQLVCVAPPRAGHQPGPVSVSVCVNGQDCATALPTSDSSVGGAGAGDLAIRSASAWPADFVYVEPTLVTSLRPARGPVKGGTAVTITGSGFLDTPDLMCKFGDNGASGDTDSIEPIVVDAIYISATDSLVMYAINQSTIINQLGTCLAICISFNAALRSASAWEAASLRASSSSFFRAASSAFFFQGLADIVSAHRLPPGDNDTVPTPH